MPWTDIIQAFRVSLKWLEYDKKIQVEYDNNKGVYQVHVGWRGGTTLLDHARRRRKARGERSLPRDAWTKLRKQNHEIEQNKSGETKLGNPIKCESGGFQV